MAGTVGEYDLAAGQPPERCLHRSFEYQHALQVVEAVGFKEEMGRIGAVVAHQAEKCGAVARPVVLAQPVGFVLIDAEVALDVLPHGAVDVREDVGVGVVEGIVQVE